MPKVVQAQSYTVTLLKNC